MPDAATNEVSGWHAPMLPGTSTSTLTPVGRFLSLFGLLLVAGGLYVGFGLHAHSVGVDGTTLKDLQNAHAVDCGTAFNVEYSSPLCEDALSGKKTTAIVMLVAGGGAAIAGRTAFKNSHG